MIHMLLATLLMMAFTLARTCLIESTGDLSEGNDRDEDAVEPKEIVTAAENETGINHLLASFQNAYSTHNPATVADLYTAAARWLAAAGLVVEGREAIRATLEYLMIAVPNVLTLSEKDRIVFGDHAVSIGTYTLTDEVGSKVALIGGSYLNVLRKDKEGWRIISQQMNYNFQISAEQWVGTPEVIEALPEEGTLGTLAETFETRYNLGDRTKLAELFTEDGWVSFRASPLVAGRDAITCVLEEAVVGPLHLAIHDVNTLELGGGMVLDVGWYKFTSGVNHVQWGTYSLVAKHSPKDEWLIHWLVSTSSPQ